MQTQKAQVEQILNDPEIERLYGELFETNLEIWNGMNRIFEIGDSSTSEYEPLARNITEMNKQRSYIKKKIDTRTKSFLTEEKSYFIPE